MAERVVLHIGLTKAGTTFLQGRLDTNRRLLAEQGVLFPGPSWRRQVKAVADFREAPSRQPGSWISLLEEINDHPGTAVVSMESLALLGPPKIALLGETLDTPDLRIVVGVRDLGRTVPAMWQQVVQNRRTWTWEEYVESIRTDGRAGKTFWRLHHAGTVVTRWAQTLTPEGVYVVTVPRPGASGETLWERFSEVAGIEPAHWQAAPRSGESLGAASTLVIRELNLRTPDLSLQDYRRRVKAVAKHVLASARPEAPIGFEVPPWLRQVSEDIRAQIRASGAHVVGDLDELVPLDVPGTDPGAVDAPARLEAALAALEVTVRELGRVSPP